MSDRSRSSSAAAAPPDAIPAAGDGSTPAARPHSPRSPRSPRSDWATVRSLLPYLWQHRGRIALALALLIAAKAANVGVPVLLKGIVDTLAPAAAAGSAAPAIAVPIGLILGYGLLRLSTSLFTELRELVFIKVTQQTVREIGLRVFRHLYELSLRFHLDRQTGGLTRDIERGQQGISTLVSYTLYSVIPTVIELAMVFGYLLWHYDRDFTLIALAALLVYVAWTVAMTEWRIGLRRTMNQLDSKANVHAVDALMNYETVKYFGNEAFEARRYDRSLRAWEKASVRSHASMSLLNVGQSAIIALAITAMVWRATVGVADGRMTIGDLVLVNAFMIQLYAPLGYLGVLYRQIKQSLTDTERLFSLFDAHREVIDAPGAPALVPRKAEVRFEGVRFDYDGKRGILDDVSFQVPAGQTVAVVGASGAGKSTLARLLFRFYDVTGGRITIDGQDIREVTQASLRAAIGIVPQDTVLFNDTLRYNIAYGDPGASDNAIDAAADAAQLTSLIARLPEGWQTPVGERGLKLSGGEKQRVAIARMLLKNPPIVVLDEATSALDSDNEQAIQAALERLAAGRTTLVIAHRLSTIVHADRIIVLHEGCVVESGRHDELVALGGRYAALWALQGQAKHENEARKKIAA